MWVVKQYNSSEVDGGGWCHDWYFNDVDDGDEVWWSDQSEAYKFEHREDAVDAAKEHGGRVVKLKSKPERWGIKLGEEMVVNFHYYQKDVVEVELDEPEFAMTFDNSYDANDALHAFQVLSFTDFEHAEVVRV